MANETETSDTGVAKNDAYTGLLAISLIALIVGSALLFLDWSQHSAAPTKFNIPALPAPGAAKKDGALPLQPADKDAANKDAANKDAANKDAANKDAPEAK